MWNAADRRRAVRSLLVAFWMMLTLVLLFVVLLLVRQMWKNGQDPLAALRNASPPAAKSADAGRTATSLGQHEVLLYFANADASALVPETRIVDRSDSAVENCRVVLQELLKGPATATLTPILPTAAEIKAIYLLDDELVLDFSSSLHMEQGELKSASLEALMIYGIVNTLTQGALQTQRELVREVRFLVEGYRPPDSFPAHIDLSQPLTTDPRWNEQVMERTAAS